MRRTFADARRWTEFGTERLLAATRDWGEPELSAPSGLPDWTRKHLVAHLAANADALGNLVHWAATGERTPMYSSPEQRAADIEAGAKRSAPELTTWLRESAERLAAAMNALDERQWRTEVVTAQGRTVPATEVPWMRAREVCVHAVDLAADVGFSDLPADFLAALADDVVGKRGAKPDTAVALTATDTGETWHLPGTGTPVEVSGSLADVTAYLTGRPHAVATTDGSSAPDLAAWL